MQGRVGMRCAGQGWDEMAGSASPSDLGNGCGKYRELSATHQTTRGWVRQATNMNQPTCYGKYWELSATHQTTCRWVRQATNINQHKNSSSGCLHSSLGRSSNLLLAGLQIFSWQVFSWQVGMRCAGQGWDEMCRAGLG